MGKSGYSTDTEYYFEIGDKKKGEEGEEKKKILERLHRQYINLGLSFRSKLMPIE